MLDITKIAAVVAKENLTLSLSGLPDGITASISPKTGTPPYTATVTFADSSAMAGTYSVKLLVHSTTSGDNSYSFVLTVTGTTVTLCSVAGTYLNGTAACTANGSYDFTDIIMNDSSDGKQDNIQEFCKHGLSCVRIC